MRNILLLTALFALVQLSGTAISEEKLSPIVFEQKVEATGVDTKLELFEAIKKSEWPDQVLSQLHLRYKLSCHAKSDSEGGLTAEYSSGTHRIRLQLYPERQQASAILGILPSSSEQNPKFKVVNSKTCKLEKLVLSFSARPNAVAVDDGIDAAEWGRLARRHAPFIVLRPDQVANPLTDAPLVLAYSLVKHPEDKNLTKLKFTVLMSDEDTKTNAKATDAQMARYGRRSDIEWIYEVVIDKRNAKPVSATFHSGFIKNYGAGHGTHKFAGKFLPGTKHPILYNVVSPEHNVFSDVAWSGHKQLGLFGHHLVPSHYLQHPVAREFVQFREPWTFINIDREMSLEKKLSYRSDEYLYVLLKGKRSLKKGALVAKVTLADGTVVKSGQSKDKSVTGNLDRLGEDLWGREAFTAVPLGEAAIKELGKEDAGKNALVLEKTSYRDPDLELDSDNPVEFYRLTRTEKGYTLENISELFECSGEGMDLKCRF